jgi:hypothetical protein
MSGERLNVAQTPADLAVLAGSMRDEGDKGQAADSPSQQLIVN